MAKYQYLEWFRESPLGMDDSSNICCIFQLTSSLNISLLFSNLGLGSQGICEHGGGSFRPSPSRATHHAIQSPCHAVSLFVFSLGNNGAEQIREPAAQTYMGQGGGGGGVWREAASLFFCRHAQRSLVILMKEEKKMGLYRTLIFPKSWLPSHLPFCLSM